VRDAVVGTYALELPDGSVLALALRVDIAGGRGVRAVLTERGTTSEGARVP
jgi:hypothetical protein